MSELPEPKFRKTKSDKWAVMAPVATLEAALAADGKVQVLKKSGDYSSFIVGSLGKPFDVDGVQMCYGYAPEDSGSDDSGSGDSGSDGSGSARASRRAPVRRTPPVEPPPDDLAPPSFDPPEPPPRDETEPLPEYQGEDHWDNGF